MRWLPLALALVACAADPSGVCEIQGRQDPAQAAEGARTSWAKLTPEAVDAIASYGVPVVDFGAGTGWWSHHLAAAGVDVVAYDDWSGIAGRPERLWHPVRTGGVGALRAHSDRALLLVYPPAHTDMAARALEAWGGDLLFYVGEVYRVTATPEFFGMLRDGWHLVETVDLPNWPGKVDELYVLRRGDPDGSWIVEALGRCVPEHMAQRVAAQR